MMKIITIIGARPQFVKAAAVSREIAKYQEVKEIIVHTGQHFDRNMSDVFFEEMEIPRPHYNLDIHGLSHGAMTGKMIAGIEEVLLAQKPDLVLVYGDTNSTLAGTLFILCTVHRAENTDNFRNLSSIFSALNKIAKETRIVLPLHPRTRKIMESYSIRADVDAIDPVGYFDMLELLKNCSLVMTDSGGLQKEAFFFKKHCVTMREETEWVELVEGGFNVLAGSDPQKIYDSYR